MSIEDAPLFHLFFVGDHLGIGEDHTATLALRHLVLFWTIVGWSHDIPNPVCAFAQWAHDFCRVGGVLLDAQVS